MKQWISQLNLNQPSAVSMRIWIQAIDGFYQSLGKLPEINQLDVAIQGQLIENQSRFDQAEFAQVLFDCQNAARLASSWQNEDKNVIGQLGRELLSSYLKEQITSSYLVRIQQDPGHAAKLVNDLSSALTAVNGSVSLSFGSQFPGGYFPVDHDRTVQPVGIGFVDKMLCGGLLNCEVVGHAAPIGQGKTTLVSQIAYSRALTVLYGRIEEARRLGVPDINWTNLPQIYFCVYENVQNLLSNFISNAATIPRGVALAAAGITDKSKCPFSSKAKQNWNPYERNQWKDQFDHCESLKRVGKPAPWPDGELERFDKAVRVIDSMIRIIDFSGYDTELLELSQLGIVGISDYIKAHQEAVGKPGVSFVAVDFAGALVDNAVASGKLKITERTDYIRMLPQVAGRDLGNVFKAPIWMAHQLNATENKRGLGTVPDPHSSEGSGMFLTYCSIGIASGRLSKDNVSVYILGKQRRLQTTAMDMQLGRLDSEYARWQQADKFVLVDNQIMKRDQVYGGARLPPAGGVLNADS